MSFALCSKIERDFPIVARCSLPKHKPQCCLQRAGVSKTQNEKDRQKKKRETHKTTYVHDQKKKKKLLKPTPPNRNEEYKTNERKTKEQTSYTSWVKGHKQGKGANETRVIMAGR